MVDEKLSRVILFLDFDGVINSRQFRQEPMVIDLSGEVESDGAEAGIDPKALARVQRICREVNADIVITSTWRDVFSQSELVDIFEKRGWPQAPIIGVTSNLQGVGGKRGDEVRLWIDRNKFTGSYLCLDDKDDFHEGQNVFFTDFEYGLQDEDVGVIINMLRGGVTDNR